MKNCTDLDSLITPYVDDELAAADREAVDRHVRACGPCQARVLAEQTIRDLIRTKKAALNSGRAPDALRARCASFGTLRTGFVSPRTASDARPADRVATWRPRLAPLALAAGLVLVVGGAFVYQLTDRSARVLAAELTADHLKCFGVINGMLGTHDEPAAVEGKMASSFGWRMRLPEQPDRAGLRLVGARPCLYGEGRVAHIMYRHNGRPVSVFMLPKTTRPEEVVEVMGHEAAIWSAGDRTFVLIAREPPGEVARIVSFVQAGLQ